MMEELLNNKEAIEKGITNGYISNYNKLYDLYNKCYGDDSNFMFDELHDDLLYQIRGANETIEEGSISLTEARDFSAMVKEIEAYHEAVTKAPVIGWMYG